MFINEKIVILYGSQTGNAQDLAERLWRDSKRFYFKAYVKSMDDYNILELVNENCAIFVCATTGQGEEPDNMKMFWKFLLRKNLPTDSLTGLKFAVLGLGDSSYVKFNFAAKRLHKRLLQLGGHSILNVGLGDDQHDLGYDAVADLWIESLWTNILSIYPLPKDLQPLERIGTITPRWGIKKLLHNHHKIDKQQSMYFSTRKPTDFTSTVLDNFRTTHPDHFQDVRFIRLKTQSQPYSPGDVAVLRPRNLPWQVEEFKEVLKSNGVDFQDSDLQLIQNDPDLPLPPILGQDLNFNQLCDEYFDLMAIPRRRTFEILAHLTDSDLEKEKCKEFTTAEGQEELYTYCNRPKRNIVEVLQDFPHATKNLTLEMLFEIFPPIKPREFSIASSYKKHKNEIHILLAVVKYKTKLVKERFGLCSNYLANLKSGDQVTVALKKGSFRFPQDPSIPVIMVGPGTGFAPFRNFIFDHVAEDTASSNTLILFFGCRHRDNDFHCKEELLQLNDEKKLTLIPAFSREQDNKIYVQHKIMENAALVWEALDKGGYIFIAGSAKFMPQEVKEAIQKVCEICGKLTQLDARKFVENLEKYNRYQTECWS